MADTHNLGSAQRIGNMQFCTRDLQFKVDKGKLTKAVWGLQAWRSVAVKNGENFRDSFSRRAADAETRKTEGDIRTRR